MSGPRHAANKFADNAFPGKVMTIRADQATPCSVISHRIWEAPLAVLYRLKELVVCQAGVSR